MNLSRENPEDVDTACEDHAYDAARYFLVSVPAIGFPKKEKWTASKPTVRTRKNI